MATRGPDGDFIAQPVANALSLWQLAVAPDGSGHVVGRAGGGAFEHVALTDVGLVSETLPDIRGYLDIGGLTVDAQDTLHIVTVEAVDSQAVVHYTRVRGELHDETDVATVEIDPNTTFVGATVALASDGPHFVVGGGDTALYLRPR